MPRCFLNLRRVYAFRRRATRDFLAGSASPRCNSLKLVASPPGYRSAVDQAIPPVGLPGQLVIVGRDHERQVVLGLQAQEQVPDDLAGLRVEVAGLLVGQDDPGAPDQGARDRDPLLLAARQLARTMGLAVPQADLLQGRGPPAPPRAPAPPPRPPPQH